MTQRPADAPIRGWVPTAVEWPRLQRGDRVLDLIFVDDASAEERRWGQRLLGLEVGRPLRVLDRVVGATGC